MSGHTLAVIFFAALLFQVACAIGTDKDPRPWTAPRRAGLAAGCILLTAAIWLAVDAL